jgi:hypothetical protein
MAQTVTNPSNLGGVANDASGVQRAAPVAVAGAAAGTSPPVPVMSADSSDVRGSLTFGSGTTPGAGTVVAVTFAAARDPNRLPVVLCQETTSAMAGVDFATVVTATGFTIVTNTRNLAASQPNTTYGVAWSLID